MTNKLIRPTIQRYGITIKGVVQGVGFRPFIYRLAEQLDLCGWVINASEGVIIEIEGDKANVDLFMKKIKADAPVLSRIDSFQSRLLEVIGEQDFRIHQSYAADIKTTLIMPDIATCAECVNEVFDPNDRRYLYPFTNCTHCGPRYSIIDSIPYDRKSTAMKNFRMCRQCQQEYDDPLNRRFHAQPNACPECGPRVALWDERGNVICVHQDAMIQAVHHIKTGKIVAVKGIGGFHLFCSAQSETSVKLLRTRKHRPSKPFAVMFPNFEWVKNICEVSESEEALLTSGQAPIVLLKKKAVATFLADNIAPDNSYLGVVLPYSPIHHILMRELRIPVIATSGNLSTEPICIDEQEALNRLEGIADYFLIHDRPIVRSVDDSVVQTMMSRPFMLRRSRGYSPLPITVSSDGPSVLSVGGHLKNTVAVNVNQHVFLSQHIGDLETQQSYAAFREATQSLQDLYELSPEYVIHDAHPDYASTHFAKKTGLSRMEVQHHHAHIGSCMAENRLDGDVLGIVWDGSGSGTDQMMWGGEFLLANLVDFERVGYFKPFPLLGGEKAIVEPRRTALGVLWRINHHLENFREVPAYQAFLSNEIKLLEQMLRKKYHTPATSSAGRLFDAVASLLDVCHFNHFEGQAASMLEYLTDQIVSDEHYDYYVDRVDGKSEFDWVPMIKEIISDSFHVPTGLISVKFHNTLVEMAVDVAKNVKEQRIVLSGGCFQNTYLAERMIARLREEGFLPYWHRDVPTNDGGIALGQTVIGLNKIKANSVVR